MNLIQRHAIVEPRFRLVSKVSQPVPLAAALGVEGPDVVIDDPRRFLIDVLVELLPAEDGQVALGVEGPVDVDSMPGLNFVAGGGFDDVVREAVERAELVVLAVAFLEVGM